MGGNTGFWAAAVLAAAFALIACEPEKESGEAGGEKASAGSTGAGNATAPDATSSGSGNDLTRFGGKPYKVYPDGKVDYATWRGSNLYAGECLRCHGENGEGSSFAPSLIDALKTMDYDGFVTMVTSGHTVINSASNEVMPSFGDNPTLMKYIDSLYAYLKGLSDGALPLGDLDWEGPKDE